MLVLSNMEFLKKVSRQTAMMWALQYFLIAKLLSPKIFYLKILEDNWAQGYVTGF